MRTSTVCISMSLAFCALSSAQDEFPGEQLESLPEAVIASMEVRDRFVISLPKSGTAGFEFVVEDAVRWQPGSTVTVAFLGGTPQLHRDIQEATRQITDICNIKLDFGFPDAQGPGRSWSTQDTEHKAQIRVSFDLAGNFSLVGTDSINPEIGKEGETVGGRANQRSLNLGGYDHRRPQSWRGTVRHEFMHAVGFHHEHSHTSGVCDNEFRWQDDPGYIPTRDARGAYIKDRNGKLPGIYTYLAGNPNFWPRSKVDHNLRSLPVNGYTIGQQIDRASVMLYRFPALFYRRSDSPCAPAGDGENLSEGDRNGLQYLYPNDAANIAVLNTRQTRFFDRVLREATLPTQLKNAFESLKTQSMPAK